MRLADTFIRMAALATACLTASAVSAAECVIPVEGRAAAGRIYDIRPPGETPRLVGAENGLFRLDGDRLAELEIEDRDASGRVYDIRPPGETPRLVRAENGLFRLDGTRLVPVEGSAAAGRIYDIRPSGETPRLVGADKGLFRLNGDRLAELKIEGRDASGRVYEIGPPGETPRLVRTENGLFRLDKARLVPVEGGDAAGRVQVIRPPGEMPRLIGAENGLFRLDGDRLAPVEGGAAAGRVQIIRPPGETPRLIGAENGLFRLDGDRLVPVEGSGAAGRVQAIGPSEGTPRLINAGYRLFRFDGDRLVPVEGSDAAGNVYGIGSPGEKPGLISAREGLFRLDGDRLVLVEGSDAAGPVFDIRPPGETPRLIRAWNGLFEYVNSEVEVANAPGRVWVLRRPTHLLRWDVVNKCFSVRLPEGRLAARIEGVEGLFGANAFRLVDADHPGTLGVVSTVPVEAGDGEELVAWLQYRDSEDEPWRDLVGSRTVIEVNWSAMDHALDGLSRFGGWAVAGHALLFALLLLVVRRSSRAWKILSDPVLNKGFLWFWFAMRHLPALQRRLLSRWFHGVQTRVDPAPHVPLPVTGRGRDTFYSADLVTETRPGRRLWVQGNTGMGKTALVDHLVARYFDDPDEPRPPAWTLARAFCKYRYVAIPVALREHATVPIPAAPEDWIFELVGRELARGGLTVADRRLLKGIVTSGGVVLVLDGANEVEDDGAILQFALRHPEVGLLVTSQTLPDADAARLFEEWRLPQSIASAVAPLLVAWLGEEQGKGVAEAVAASPIKEDIRSGYDVRLLADLVEGGTEPTALPETRMGLYEAMLARAERADGSTYPLPELCRIAWDGWSIGKRRLTEGDGIPEALIAPLRAEGVRILRPVEGRSFEFRHDQMRGYLAARWAGLHEVSPVDLFEKTDSIWRLSRSEQQVVWGFFAELIGRERGPAVLDWATLHAERAELQVALRRVARRDSWPAL